MNHRRLLVPVALVAFLAGNACASDDTKKKNPDKDASTADGSSGSGGSGGSAGASGTGGSAGADAAAGSGGSAGVSGSAGSDAGLDATADADASSGCATGTVRNLQTSACLACPADAGTAGAAGAAGGDAGGDPYLATLTCQAFASSATSFDPTTGLLVIHLDYALQVDSLDYALSLQGTDGDGGYLQANPTGTVPVVANTVTLDLGAMLGTGATVDSMNIISVAYTDACGRVASFDNQACDIDYLQLDQVDGGTWVSSCSPC